jgi:hypothetical protein
MKLRGASFFVCVVIPANRFRVKRPAHKARLSGSRPVKDVDEKQ